MTTKSLLSSSSIGLALLLSGTGYSQTSPTPFPTRNFVYIGKPGLNASTSPIQLFNTFSPSAANGGFGSSGTPITFNGTPAQGLNAAGINPIDQYLYATDYLYSGPSTASANFYRIGVNGRADQVGILTAPTSADAGRPAPYSFVNCAAGTVDQNGDYWFTAYTLTNVTPPVTGAKLDFFVGKVDNLSSLASGNTQIVPTYYHIDISDPILQTGFTNFISSALAFTLIGEPFTNANGGFQDMDLNPADRKFYSYIAFPSTATPLGSSPYPEAPINSHLVRIDPIADDPTYWGKVTVINQTPNTVPNYEEDGAWFDENGAFRVLFTNGQYAQVNMTTGALSGLTTTNLPLSGGEMRGDLATNAISNPLPVKLLSFTATPASQQVQLRWVLGDYQLLQQTAVERSADGQSFTTLTTNTRGQAENQFTDPAPLSSTAYYRLRLTGVDGKVGYSNVLQVTGKAAGSEVATTAYPNPVRSTLHLQSTTANVAVTITDLQGRTLLSEMHSGTGTVQLSQLPEGTYHLSVANSETGAVLLSQLLQKL
ncbi:MAG: T9SS type A sorting domain-containing protein [Sphingobacteriales bacterium]|nr:MAG: T9SS type A sorting domain-containing protein [Sphingobacteriales bacterium]